MNREPLQYRNAWLAIGALLVGFTVWFSLGVVPPDWAYAWGERFLHAAVYAVLVFWFGQIYPGVRRQLALAVGVTLMGVLLELLQVWATTARRFDGADIVANGVGAGGACILLWTPAGRWLRLVDGYVAARRAGR